MCKHDSQEHTTYASEFAHPPQMSTLQEDLPRYSFRRLVTFRSSLTLHRKAFELRLVSRMTDLCHNCGRCHFPRPCAEPLYQCKICGDIGHVAVFCPLSIHRFIPNFAFLGLCHNCYTWHLPQICAEPRYVCSVCTHGGHREAFCPVQPYRPMFAIEQVATLGLNASGSTHNSGMMVVLY